MTNGISWWEQLALAKPFPVTLEKSGSRMMDKLVLSAQGCRCCVCPASARARVGLRPGQALRDTE